jgi:hypothetical protein
MFIDLDFEGLMTSLEETFYDYEEIGSLFLSPVVAL